MRKILREATAVYFSVVEKSFRNPLNYDIKILLARGVTATINFIRVVSLPASRTEFLHTTNYAELFLYLTFET